MENHIISIKLFDEEPINQYNFEEKLTFEPISKVNILVGQNNSGKSRFLREVFNNNNISFRFSAINLETLSEILDSFIDGLNRSVFIHNIIGLGPIRLSTFTGFKDSFTEHKNIGKDSYSELKSLLKRALEIPEGTVETRGIGGGPPESLNYYYNNLKSLAKDHLERLEKTQFGKYVQKKQSRIYIPILRGMRPLKEIQDNLYLNRTLSDYFNNAFEKSDKIEKEVFTGLELYESVKSKLLGEPEDRDAIKNVESFLSENFFNKQSITLIPRVQADTVFIKIGNEPQLPIYYLGDGLQNLIIIVYNIILRQEDTIFFIEEPDLAMHPGLQRELIKQMLKHEKHQFFITTHSNHLLDLTLDYNNISVFHFSKVIKNENVMFKVESKSNNERHLLQDLGVKNSSVFLANCSIWVEGITDRLYLRSYMKKFIDENKDISYSISLFKEDIDYIFVEYQGSNITHWDFSMDKEVEDKIKVAFLCGNPIVVADGDVSKRKAREAELFETLNDRFIKLKCKEIENLIPEIILQKYLTNKFADEFDSIDSIKFSDYCVEEKGLGEYLDEMKKDESPKTFSTDSGTIKNKINFCNDIVSLMEEENSWSLPDELKEVCERIFSHIAKAGE